MPSLEKQPSLTVILGPMYAGKTSELIRQSRGASDPHKVACFKPALDNRYGNSRTLCSHDHVQENAIAFDHQHPEQLLNLLSLAVEDVLIDEVQFCAPQIMDVVEQLLAQGKKVVVAGLDLDSDGNAFGSTLALAEKAEAVVRLTAICEHCGGSATHSKAIKAKTDTVVVGEKDMYIAVCEACFK